MNNQILHGATVLLALFVGMLLPGFRASYKARRAERRKLMVKSVADKMSKVDKKYVTRKDQRTNFVVVALKSDYDNALEKSSTRPVMFWPILMFAPVDFSPDAPQLKYHDGTTEYLDKLYEGIVVKSTGYKRRNFTDDEWSYIITKFVLSVDGLFIPGAGTQEENTRYDRLFKPFLPGGARVFINANT